MTDSVNSTGKCRKCGAPMSEEAPEGTDDLYCARCRIAMAEEMIAEDKIKSDLPQKRKWLWPVLKIAIGIISLGIIVFQYSKLVSVFDKPKPIRQGSYATDVGTDRCIHNLWLISKGLGEGRKAPEEGLICPVSGKPYLGDVVDGNRVVSCPDTQRHGLSILQVSRKNPVPEARP